jgi:hypothetical protein
MIVAAMTRRFDGSGRRRIGPAAVTAVLLVGISLVAAALAARVSFGLDGWLWNLDLPKIDYPLAVFFHEALARGELPLWNDRLGLGFPLYAEGQIGAFYPPNWLIFQLEPLAAMDLTRLLHLALAGVGTGLLALRVSGSRQGALLAAVVAVLGGAVVTKVEWWNLVTAYGWLPWVLLPLAGRLAPGRRALVLAGAAWGVQALAGHPNTWLLTGLAALVLLVRRPLRPAIGRVAIFAVLGGGIGAVQLLPTALLQLISVRAAGLSADDLFTSAATPFDVLGLGFVNAFIGSSKGSWDFPTTWYPDGIFALLEASCYVGLPVIGLAATGLGPRRARRWIAVAGVALAIAVVAAFRPSWWQALPILNGLRSPVRAYLLLTLAIAVLAAIGVGRLGRGPDRASRTRRGAVAIGIVVGAYALATVLVRSFAPAFEWLLRVSASHPDAKGIEQARGLAVAALTSLWPLGLELAVAVLLVPLLAAPRSTRTVGGAVLLAMLPLALLSPSANPIRPATDISYASSAFVRTLVKQAPHRVLTIGAPGYYAGMPDQLAAAGVADVDMFSSLNLAAGDDLLRRLRRDDPDGTLRRAVGIDLVVTFDAACPGRQVASVPEQNAFVCRIDDALAGPYWIPSDAFQHIGPVSAGPLTVQRSSLNQAAVLAAARPVERAAPDRPLVDRPQPAALLFVPPWCTGSQATVDGLPVTIRSADGGQLIDLTAGPHQLELRFVAWDALLGGGIGLVVLAAAVAWAGWPAWRRRIRRTN